MNYLFLVRMIFSVDKDSAVQVALRAVTKFFVLCEDLVVEGIDVCKFLVRRLPVSIDFIFNLARCLADRYHSLYVEHIFPVDEISPATACLPVRPRSPYLRDCHRGARVEVSYGPAELLLPLVLVDYFVLQYPLPVRFHAVL